MLELGGKERHQHPTTLAVIKAPPPGGGRQQYSDSQKKKILLDCPSEGWQILHSATHYAIMELKTTNGVRKKHPKVESRSLKRKRDQDDLEKLQRAVTDLVGGVFREETSLATT